MMLVDDCNIIPHGEPVQQFKSFTEFDRDGIEPKKEETKPLIPWKTQEEKFSYYFSNSKKH